MTNITKDIRAAAEQYIADEHEELFAAEVRRLIQEQDFSELEDRFYCPLAFGTGGLRGKIGGGTNRMNPLVVGRITKGLGIYLQRCYPKTALRVAICFDSRRHSRYFSKIAACILADLGIQVYLFPQARPTPLLSFAVRDQACHAGIMITASHNPPEYNGYKMYWHDGAQIVAPHDAAIEQTIASITGPVFDKQAMKNNLDLIYAALDEFHRKEMVVYADPPLEERFMQAVIAERRNKTMGLDQVSIAYTPLHGVGSSLIEKVCAALAIDVRPEPLQSIPDGEFPTVTSPNPEDPRSLERVIALSEKEGCDGCIATDPDADRIGIGVQTQDGLILIDGNQLGALVIDYLLAHSKQQKEPYVVVNTIVTSDLQSKIIQAHGAKQEQTLTGFKHIAEIIRSLHAEGKLSRFLMGTEESFGLLIGTHVWDKDSITAAVIVCEMIAYYKSKSMTLCDQLVELYKIHGFYTEKTYSFVFEGSEGMEHILAIMQKMRSQKQTTIGNYPVTRQIDFLQRRIIESDGTEQTFSHIPSSNVLKWYLDGFGWVCLRPSGTEPKIKLYYSYTEPFTTLAAAHTHADAAIKTLHAHLKGFLS